MNSGDYPYEMYVRKGIIKYEVKKGRYLIVGYILNISIVED